MTFQITIIFCLYFKETSEMVNARISRHLEEVMRARADRNHTILNYDYTDFLNLTEIDMWLDNKVKYEIQTVNLTKSCHVDLISI